MKARLKYDAVKTIVKSPYWEKQSRDVGPDQLWQREKTVLLSVNTVADPDGPLVI